MARHESKGMANLRVSLASADSWRTSAEIPRAMTTTTATTIAISVSRTMMYARLWSRRRGIRCTKATTTFCLAHARQMLISRPCTRHRSRFSGSGRFTWKTSTHCSKSRTPPLYKAVSSTLLAMWQTSVLPWRRSCSVYIASPF